MNILVTLFQDVLGQWRGNDWGMGKGGMMCWGYGGMGWFWQILMMAFWIAVIIGMIFLIRWLIVSARTGNQGTTRGDSALEILKRRYARGEINKEEFQEKKKDLEV